MKKELLKLLGELASEAKTFGAYEQYSEACCDLSDASNRVYEISADIVKLVTGRKATKKELEQFLSESVGEKGVYDSKEIEDM